VNTPRLFVHARPDHELGLFVNEDAARDQVLFPFHRVSAFKPDLRSLPMDHGAFLRSPSDMHCLINHACLPSAYIDWRNLSLRTLRHLKAGDEITLNYLTIYELLASELVCQCGAPACYREVRGFRYLSLEDKLMLEVYLSPYLKSLLDQQMRSACLQAS
jgi:SET domain-containing protein